MDIFDTREQEASLADEETKSKVKKLVSHGYHYYITKKILLFLAIGGIAIAIMNIRPFLVTFSAVLGIATGAILIYCLIESKLRKKVLKTAKYIAEAIPHKTTPFRVYFKSNELCLYEGLELLCGFQKVLKLPKRKRYIIGMLHTIGSSALYNIRRESNQRAG